MLRLYVMRHAKSSWAVPGAKDFDRELKERGISDLELVSDVMRQKQYFPQNVVCSPAARTRQTLDGIKDVLRHDVVVDFNERLYLGGEEDYLRIIRNTQGPSSLMTIGHNPMSGSLAFSLVGDGDPELIELISYKYPTSCIAVIDFDVDSWSKIANRRGYLVDCVIPSRIKQARGLQ